MSETKYEYEYAIQWRHDGEPVWHTSPKYPNREEAVSFRNTMRANNPLLVLRIVKRTVTKWEEVRDGE